MNANALSKYILHSSFFRSSLFTFHFSLLFLFISYASFAQDSDSIQIKKIFTDELVNGTSYSNLEQLCKKVGGRLSGSPQAAMAVEWAKDKMKEMNGDAVYLQEVMVPHWIRGDKEVGMILLGSDKQIKVPVCALGGSIATSNDGIKGKIIEVHGLAELQTLGKEKISGKIVFFNGPMDPSEVFSFHAYGKAVDQRWAGPSEAAKYGAIASVVRSMSLDQDDYPHTGSMRYKDSIPQIPCCAISTNGANLLSSELKKNPSLGFYFRQTCRLLPDEKSYNVYAEIKGSEKPEEIIVAGGHLDSWDLAEGAQDDGAGVVQCMEVLRIFKALGIRPKHTIRIVAFMNEENGLKGGKKYAEIAKSKNEKHLVALESDAGGFSPRGFSMEGDSSSRKKLLSFRSLLEPYGLYDFGREGGGADISPLKDQGVPLMELSPDSQRYFDFHHTAKDTFENVNRRELELCSASVAAMIYLIDKYGL